MATATIRLADLAHNLGRVRRRLRPETRVLAAVKANAYGHGSVAVARFLERQGVTWFGVATAEEALELRSGGVGADILVLTPVYRQIEALADYGVSLTLADAHGLEALERSRARRARAHLKVDTGMGRLGLTGKDALALARRAARSGAVLDGAWTHFAASDDEKRGYTLGQLEAFGTFLEGLRREGIEVPLVHAANSAAIFAYPEAEFDLVRPGIALYGYHSSPAIAALEPELRPALTLEAPVIFVKRVAAGTSVSYSGLWHAPRDTTVATLRIGYGDGYPRLLTGRAEVLLHGERRPVAGRICMDQLMVDAGDLPVAVGDTATLFGPGPLDAEVLGGRIGTISYELLTSLAPRVERVYL